MMPNSIFNALNNNNQGGNMAQQFQRFLTEMKGKDPNAEIQSLLQSGRINQQQLNRAQQMAQQFQSFFVRRRQEQKAIQKKKKD